MEIHLSVEEIEGTEPRIVSSPPGFHDETVLFQIPNETIKSDVERERLGSELKRDFEAGRRDAVAAVKAAAAFQNNLLAFQVEASRAQAEDREPNQKVVASLQRWAKKHLDACSAWMQRTAPSDSADTQPVTATDYVIHTSQEIDILTRARCDGKSFASYLMNHQAAAITYERKELSHRVRLELTPEEVHAGLSISFLENLIRSQDSDGAFAQQYIMRALAPPAPLQPRTFAGGWIDFDDVIDKIGWYPQTTEERRQMHAKIWGFVRYGERAQIIGKRTGKYKDKSSGKEIDTEIHGAAWRILKTETPQSSLFPERDTPVRAQIVMSQELTALITSPQTAQYLAMGEVLGKIPGGKPAGAWARVIGLALASFWRRNPREAMNGSLRPTRRELLAHYAPKIAPYDEVLESNDPGRAIKYWCTALVILADTGFIARAGEAMRTVGQIREGLPRQGWKEAWLNEEVTIEPGAGAMEDAVAERAAALPAIASRRL
jgi:hypothetical protein